LVDGVLDESFAGEAFAAAAQAAPYNLAWVKTADDEGSTGGVPLPSRNFCKPESVEFTEASPA
jgi:hypothetical protein